MKFKRRQVTNQLDKWDEIQTQAGDQSVQQVG